MGRADYTWAMAKNDVQTLWEDVRAWLSDATRTAIREAEDLSRRGRLKMDIMSLSRRIEKELAQLGGVVYDRVAKRPDEPFALDPEVKKLIQTIGTLSLIHI